METLYLMLVDRVERSKPSEREWVIGAGNCSSIDKSFTGTFLAWSTASGTRDLMWRSEAKGQIGYLEYYELTGELVELAFKRVAEMIIEDCSTDGAVHAQKTDENSNYNLVLRRMKNFQS